MADYQSFYAEVGRRVYRARRKAKLTQEALAERVGLSRTSITNIEKGRQKLLLHSLADLARELNVDSSSLLPHSKPKGTTDDLLESWLDTHTAKERRWAKAALKHT